MIVAKLTLERAKLNEEHMRDKIAIEKMQAERKLDNKSIEKLNALISQQQQEINFLKASN
jgi:hypothetical protein